MDRRTFLLGIAAVLLSSCGERENSMSKKAKEYGKKLAAALVNAPRPLNKEPKPKKTITGR
jgi:hypothetical protein